jgi:transcriptional regulator with XRE-family HTH domain
VGVDFLATILAMPEMGHRIVAVRIRAGYRTQGALANALGVSRGLVGQWESGHKQPGRVNLANLAKLCGISMEYLQGNTAEMGLAPTVSARDEIELLIMFRRMAPLSKQNLLYIASVLVDPHGVTRKKPEKV